MLIRYSLKGRDQQWPCLFYWYNLQIPAAFLLFTGNYAIYIICTNLCWLVPMVRNMEFSLNWRINNEQQKGAAKWSEISVRACLLFLLHLFYRVVPLGLRIYYIRRPNNSDSVWFPSLKKRKSIKKLVRRCTGQLFGSDCRTIWVKPKKKKYTAHSRPSDEHVLNS